jgi:protein TonB
MKKIFFSIMISLFIFCAGASAQEQETKATLKVSDSIRPAYPGGVPAFYKYIEKGIKKRHMPSKSGKVIASFIVEKDGSISNVKIVKGLEQKTDGRVVELVSESEGWTPGYINGLPVRASYNLPVTINVH